MCVTENAARSCEILLRRLGVCVCVWQKGQLGRVIADDQSAGSQKSTSLWLPTAVSGIGLYALLWNWCALSTEQLLKHSKQSCVQM